MCHENNVCKWLNKRMKTSYPIFALAGGWSILETTLLIGVIHLTWSHSWIKKVTLGRLIIKASTTAWTVQHKGSKEIRYSMDNFSHNYETRCSALCFSNFIHAKQCILPPHKHKPNRIASLKPEEEFQFFFLHQK